MSSDFKTAAVPHGETIRPSHAYRIAIVGAGSLKGKEVAEALNERNFPSLDVKLLDDDEALGKLETMKDEVTFIQSARTEQFQHIDFTFFASDPESTKRTWTTARRAGSDIVDLSYALEDEAGAVLRSPWIERQLGRPFTPELQPAPAVVAHPAAIVLALLHLRAQKAGEVIHSAATIFEPASEHGQKGIDELHEQTVNLLSFQQLPTATFDVQIAFNMISQYGAHSVPALSTVRARVLEHFQRLVSGQAQLPSILLAQAPVFHGHVFAIHLRFRNNADIGQLAAALAGEHITIAQSADEPPNNVNVAGQNGILVSLLADDSDPQSCWLWAASDNLRIAALTAVECAESMAAARPRGKIQ